MPFLKRWREVAVCNRSEYFYAYQDLLREHEIPFKLKIVNRGDGVRGGRSAAGFSRPSGTFSRLYYFYVPKDRLEEAKSLLAMPRRSY